MTELQLVLVRLFAVSLWLLRTRRVETVATWSWVRFLQHSDRPIVGTLGQSTGGHNFRVSERC